MRIPQRILDASDQIGEALNYTLYYRGGWIDIRALDAIIVGVFSIFVAYAWVANGWVAAGQVAMMFVLVALCCLWFFPSDKKMK